MLHIVYAADCAGRARAPSDVSEPHSITRLNSRSRATACMVAMFVVALMCFRPDPARPAPEPEPVAVTTAAAALTGHAPAHLNILTWNIWMMPPWTFQSPRNERRAGAIAAELLRLDFDILCLQKAFDADARKVLSVALASTYPYSYGPANSGRSWRLNGGVWVLSRIPLSQYREIQFRDCAGIECLARKGALALAGEIGGHPFELVGTHLQGGAGPRITPKRQPVRDRQVAQIRDELLDPTTGVPTFICGDFVTPRIDEVVLTQESAGYRQTLQTLGVENGTALRITLDEDRAHNDVSRSRGKRTGELDYVFVDRNDAEMDLAWQRLILRHQGWDGRRGRLDLSYRYAVSLSVDFR